MLNLIIALILGLVTWPLQAHQLTPTYPVFTPSYVEGVLYTKMELFNSRKEVEYYELGVFDSNWKPIVFASEDGNIMRVRYLEIKKINVYIKAEDIKSVVYICTLSKLRREDVTDTAVSSKICSKVK